MDLTVGIGVSHLYDMRAGVSNRGDRAAEGVPRAYFCDVAKLGVYWLNLLALC